jgi:hypothetical protein
MWVAQSILVFAAAYAALGVLFALAFVTRGVGRVDSAARGAPLLFRLLILPGAALLWPVMASLWLHACRRES